MPPICASWGMKCSTWARPPPTASTIPITVIALGARLIGIETARDCLANFLATPFAGGRHQRRVDKLTNPDLAKEPA